MSLSLQELGWNEAFEKAFKSLNLSTIKLSKERRNLSEYFVQNFEKIQGKDELDLLDNLMENVL